MGELQPALLLSGEERVGCVKLGWHAPWAVCTTHMMWLSKNTTLCCVGAAPRAHWCMSQLPCRWGHQGTQAPRASELLWWALVGVARG